MGSLLRIKRSINFYIYFIYPFKMIVIYILENKELPARKNHQRKRTARYMLPRKTSNSPRTA